MNNHQLPLKHFCRVIAQLETHHLRLPPTLYQRLPSAVLGHRLDVVCKPIREARHTEKPEYQPEWECESSLDARRLGPEMEGDHYGYADDSHVRAETQPGEKCPFVGAMIARI